MSVRGVGEPRTPAEWAQLHAGIEFIQPQRERELAQLRACGYAVRNLAVQYDMDESEVERSLARTARTLATWERNACKWSTRFVAVEPNSQYPNGASERDQRTERQERYGPGKRRDS